jgi:hypothetical protein
MPKNWKAVGPTTVRCARRGTYDFASLAEAVSWLGWRTVEGLDYGNVTRFTLPPSPFYWAYPRHEITLWDECDVLVPVWRVREEALACGAKAAWDRRVASWNRRKRWETYVFRRGPVPHVRSKWHWCQFRRICTRQERALAAGMATDETMVEFGIRPRPSRGHTALFDDREDIQRSTSRCWKDTRRTQWRA